MLDKVTGAHMLDQVAGVQVVVHQVAGTQVVGHQRFACWCHLSS